MKEVFILVGFYQDHSGANLLGVYEHLGDAEDRKKLIDSVYAAMQVRIVKMPIGSSFPQEIF